MMFQRELTFGNNMSPRVSQEENLLEANMMTFQARKLEEPLP